MRSHTLRGQVSAQARGAAASIDACATLAVVVDDRLTDPDLSPSLPSVAGRLVAELADELDTSSAPVIGAWATRGIAAGSPWWTLLGRPDRGVLTDPALSSIALERLVEGQPVYRSRQELLDTLASRSDPRRAGRTSAACSPLTRTAPATSRRTARTI